MSRITSTVVVVLSVASAMLGCEQQKTQPRSVEYFASNIQERDAKRALCNNNPGVGKDDPECINAERAWLQSADKNVPKIDFPKKALK